MFDIERGIQVHRRLDVLVGGAQVHRRLDALVVCGKSLEENILELTIGYGLALLIEFRTRKSLLHNKSVLILVVLHAEVDQPLHGCADSFVHNLGSTWQPAPAGILPISTGFTLSSSCLSTRTDASVSANKNGSA